MSSNVFAGEHPTTSRTHRGVRKLVLLLMLIGLAGCGKRTGQIQPDAASPDSSADLQPDAPNKAEMSEAGWPYTTKQFTGELVHVAPDGTEKVLPLYDRTVAVLESKINEGKADEFAFKLQYLRHRNGEDLYELTYQTSPHNRKTIGPFAYSGEETTIGFAGSHGTFILRPSSQPIHHESN